MINLGMCVHVCEIGKNIYLMLIIYILRLFYNNVLWDIFGCIFSSTCHVMNFW